MSDLEVALAAEWNTIRGRICGMIESFGLRETQERGAIATFKSLTYDSQATMADLIKED